MERRAILFPRHRRLEGRLVQIRIELLPLLARVESLKPVLLQRLHQDLLGHRQALVQADKVLVTVLARHLLRRHRGERAVQVVHRIHEILGESLDGELVRGLNISFRSLLQVAELGN